jgi:hypothetical protein
MSQVQFFMGSMGFFSDLMLPDAMGSTQPPKEMSTRNLCLMRVKEASEYG